MAVESNNNNNNKWGFDYFSIYVALNEMQTVNREFSDNIRVGIILYMMGTTITKAPSLVQWSP
jgi:hypothetical protein